VQRQELLLQHRALRLQKLAIKVESPTACKILSSFNRLLIARPDQYSPLGNRPERPLDWPSSSPLLKTCFCPYLVDFLLFCDTLKYSHMKIQGYGPCKQRIRKALYAFYDLLHACGSCRLKVILIFIFNFNRIAFYSTK